MSRIPLDGSHLVRFFFGNPVLQHIFYRDSSCTTQFKERNKKYVPRNHKMSKIVVGGIETVSRIGGIETVSHFYPT